MSHGPTVSAALSALLHSGTIEASAYSQDLATYVAAKHAVANLSGTRRTRTSGRAQHHPGNGRRPPADPLAAADRVPDAGTQPPVVDHGTAAGRLAADLVPRQRARLGALRRAGPSDPMAGDLRRGQRLLLGTRKHAPARAALRSAPARHRARRGHCLGVHVHLRRRRPAVDERALAGHRDPAAGARLLALPRSGPPDRRPAGARDLPHAASAGSEGRRRQRRGPLRAVLLRALRSHPQRLHPIPGGALRLHLDHQGPRRGGPLRSRRRRGPSARAAL